MRPYYEQDGVTLYHGKAEDVLASIDLSVVGGVLTDPPYGIAVCDRSDGGVGSVSSGSKVYGRATWDHQPADDATIQRLVGLDVPAVVWGGNYFAMPPASCLLVWDKMQRNFTFADAEVAWTNLPGAIRLFSYSRGQLLVEGKVHPTQKPVPLMAWCLSQMRLPPESVILDPYAGSGSTLVAAKAGGLVAIGIEQEERWCEVAAARCRQGVLFPAAAG